MQAMPYNVYKHDGSSTYVHTCDIFIYEGYNVFPPLHLTPALTGRTRVLPNVISARRGNGKACCKELLLQHAIYPINYCGVV